MKRFTLAVAALGLMLSAGMELSAQPAKPTVRRGDFYCFPGMESDQINVLPAASKTNVKRYPKLGNSKFDNTDGHDLREVPSEGDIHIPVILVNFQDVSFQTREDPKALITEMLNGEDFTYQGATGSAAVFFRTMSNGQFNPTFDVYGPVTVSKNEKQYVDYDYDDTYIDPETGKPVTCYPAGRMVEEAVKGLDDEIDFSKYDIDGDGVCDFVYLFFAGQGATLGGSVDRNIWPHAMTLTAAIGAPIELDGVQVNRYCTSAELGATRRLSGIGTFCHEFGHVLGFPDLYDTKNNTGRPSECFSPGSFDTMDAGNYNNDEHTPAVYSVYEQYGMEWMKPVDLVGAGNFTMLPLEAHSFGYKVATPSNPQEYFILENRGQGFHDRFLPGHGLLVWHIDFLLSAWDANVVNNVPSHQRVDIVEADNEKSASTRDGDVFPGTSNICEFNANVTPSFQDWNNRAVGFDVNNIMHNFDSTTTFTITATSGKEQPGAEIDAVAPSVAYAKADAIGLEWPAVNGATGYFVSVFDIKHFDGSVIAYENYVPGYCFRKLSDLKPGENGEYSYEISGLDGNVTYGIMVYAINETNASRMSAPLVVATVDGTDFASAATNIYLAAGDKGEVFVEWDEVEGAEDYEVSIVTNAHGEKTHEQAIGFDGSRLPEGWSGTGRFDTREANCGVSSPSYYLNSIGATLQTPVYESPISEVEFWGKKRYSDDGSYLDIYTADKAGNWTYLSTKTDLKKDGETVKLPMPTGVYGVKFAHRYSVSDLHAYIDDIRLTFVGAPTETPVAEAQIEKSRAELLATVTGLSKGVEYAAYVTPLKGGDKGARSKMVTFMLENLPSSVDEIAIDNATTENVVVEGMTVKVLDAETVFSVYGVDGAVIASGAKGSVALPAHGIYLVKIADKTIKVIL